jgi:hypothetical protein
MGSTTESGHAKNVSSFEQLVTNCTALGAAYNPSKASLKLAALNTMLLNANNSLQAVNVANTAYKNATNARELAFKPLKKLATRIVSALAATDAPQGTVDDARSINVKIQGRRAIAVKKTTNGTEGAASEPVRTVSVSHQGFDKLIEFFAQLLQILSTEPKYSPNEADLKIAALTTLINDLKAKNSAAMAAATNLSNTRNARDKFFYDEHTGLVQTAHEVKLYVKSVFGGESSQFKQVRKVSLKSQPVA